MARVHVHRDPTKMVASVKQSATRAFVAVLALLAKSYEVVLAVSRDSSEQELLKAYRKLALKVRPDKGGRVCDERKLKEARERWETVPSPRFGIPLTALCVCLPVFAERAWHFYPSGSRSCRVT